jgi:hypothetical protein
MVWGFAVNTISTNLARDLGTRIVAAIFFGSEAFTFDHGYPWISILVNIPATIFATGYYEFLMRDSLQKIQKGHASHEDGEDGLKRHLSKVSPGYDSNGSLGQIEQGYSNALRGKGEGINKQTVD